MRAGFGALACTLVVSGCGGGSAKASAAFCDAVGPAMPALTGATTADASVTQTMGNVVADAPSDIKATAGAAADAAAKDASTLANDASAKKLAKYASDNCGTAQSGTASGNAASGGRGGSANAFCDKLRDSMHDADSYSIDTEQTPAERAAAAKTAKLYHELEPVAPPEIKESLVASAARMDNMAKSGDPKLMMGDPGGHAAKLGKYMLGTCRVFG